MLLQEGAQRMSKLRESTESNLKIVNNITDDQLSKINKLTMTEVSKDDVFVFKMLLVDDSVTRNFTNYPESFQRAILKKAPRKGNWIGLPMMMGKTEDHETMASNQVGRIFDAKLVRTPTGNIGTIGSVYIPINESTNALIDNIKAGVHREVSIGVSVELPLCSICGDDIRDCQHEPGKHYNEDLCYIIMDGDVEGQEVSFVAVPGNINAEIVADDGDYVPLTEAMSNKIIKRKENSKMAKSLRKQTQMLLTEAKRLARLSKEDLEDDVDLDDEFNEEDDDMEDDNKDCSTSESDDDSENDDLDTEEDDDSEDDDDFTEDDDDSDDDEFEEDEDDDKNISPTEAMKKVQFILKKASKQQESLKRKANENKAFREEMARETVRLGTLAKAIPVTSKEAFRKAICKMSLKEMKALQSEYKKTVSAKYPNTGKSITRESAKSTTASMSVRDIVSEFNK